jgi:hypothetical protein
MKRVAFTVLSLAAAISSAQNIYVMTSGNATYDANTVSLLNANGMTATVGLSGTTLTTATDLSGFDAIYLNNNYNWTEGITSGAEQAMVNFVASGKGLVTNEWTMWRNGASSLTILDPILPSVYGPSWRATTSVTYSRQTANALLDIGVAPVFAFDPGDAAGAESSLTARSGATVYYGTDFGTSLAGLVGWSAGGGRVYSFSTVMGLEAIADPNAGKLLANTLRAAAVPEPASLAVLGIGALFLRRRRK